MPHILAKHISFPEFPIKLKDYEYHFSVLDGDETLIFVTKETIEFLLKVKKRQNDIYLGFDKLTRPSPVGILKDSIKLLAEFLGLEIISSNLAQNTPRQKESSLYLKPIEFFVNEFSTQKEIWIEIGFGSGRHLIYQANEHPEIQFIGIEIYKPSIEQILRRINLLKLTNILVVNYDARLFLELLESNSVGKIFIHFPVPWEKKPHRRVISNSFVKEAQRVLKVGGELELRTDSELYFEYAKEIFENVNKNCLKSFTNRYLEVISKYEERWRRQQKDIFDLIFTNLVDSPKKDSNLEFSFKSVNANKIASNFKNEIYKNSEFFLHFERLYKGKDEMLLRVSFGDFDRPEHKYVYIKENSAKYLVSNPIPTIANYKAHLLLTEMLA